MIPELGHFALIVALGLALVQATLPLIGAARGIPAFMAVARPAAQGQFVFVAIAFGCLAWAFTESVRLGQDRSCRANEPALP